MEVDLRRPLKSRYRLRGDFWKLQYEGLHDICFECGRYGHRALTCPDRDRGEKESNTTSKYVGSSSPNTGPVGNAASSPLGDGEAANSRCGEWISMQWNRRQPRKMKGTSGISAEDSEAGSAGKDHIEFNHHNQRDTGEDLVGKNEGQDGGARSGHDSRTKSSGSRFARLEDMDNLEEVDKNLKITRRTFQVRMLMPLMAV